MADRRDSDLRSSFGVSRTVSANSRFFAFSFAYRRLPAEEFAKRKRLLLHGKVLTIGKQRLVGLALTAVAALGVASGLGCAPVRGRSLRRRFLARQLAVYIADRPDGSSEKRYFLRRADGTELRLLFDPAPVAGAGNRVAVQGVPEADALRVTSFQEVASGPAVATPALAAATPFSPRSFAFVFVDIGGGITGTTTPAVADAFMTSNADSIRRYYLADSYGRQDISTYVTQTALSYPMADCNSSTTSALANALRPMVGNYQHYLWYFGSTNPACNWSGLASLGTPSNPSRDTWYNHATSCVVLVQSPAQLRHAALVGADLPRWAAGRRPEWLHGQRIWRPLRSDGRRVAT